MNTTTDPRQRWRLTFARSATAAEAPGSGRDYAALWESALVGSGLPVATNDAGRPRLILAAPLPGRASGRAELLDFWLADRRPAWSVREALTAVLPDGHEITTLEDVWLGAPALSGRVAAADYLVDVRGDVDAATLAAGAARLIAARQIPRERAKGGGIKAYDLRPLLISIEPAGEAEGALRIRARIHPELGSGRPDEVVAALADDLGVPLEAGEIIRERLLLVEDLDA